MKRLCYPHEAIQEIKDYQNKFKILNVLKQKNDQFILLKAKQNLSKQEVAISAYKIPQLNLAPKEKLKDSIQQEIIRHRNVTGHPCIKGFIEVFKTKRFFCVVMELVEGETLQDFVQQKLKNSNSNRENEIRRWFQQIIICQKLLHEKHILNRSINLENIQQSCHTTKNENIKTENETNFFDLKFWDYGYLNDIFGGVSQINPICKKFFQLHLFYHSPEVLLPQMQQTTCDGYKIDVWACGVALFYLLTANYPFFDSQESVILAIEKFSRGEFKFPENCDVSTSCKILVKGMLDVNPKTRFSIQQVIDCGWFQKNLGRDWNRSFESDMREIQKDLQSEEEIGRIVEELFNDDKFETSCEYEDLSECSFDFDEIC